MYALIAIVGVLISLVTLGTLYSLFKNKIQFFVTGFDEGFSFSDLSLLWKVSQICQLEEPTSLFYSLPSLTKCMAQITDSKGNSSNDPHKQLLMTKLFNYRTKLQNQSDDKKGVLTTMALDKGQKIRILLPGKGVFASEIVNNGNKIVVSIPKQNNLIPITAEEWVNKVISVYLWRKGDARYVFDTTVEQSGLFLGKSSLFLRHSNNLVRTQKRKSVRAKCEIHGMLYIIKDRNVDYSAIETKGGYRCILQDISESGALIKIGGKGVENVQIKLQFTIQTMLIVMFGIIRTVEFNEDENQSLLHFECTHIETPMRNEVLRYVYNMLPENEKEILDAINQADSDMENETNGEAIAQEISENTENTDVQGEGDTADNQLNSEGLEPIDADENINENVSDNNAGNVNEIAEDISANKAENSFENSDKASLTKLSESENLENEEPEENPLTENLLNDWNKAPEEVQVENEPQGENLPDLNAFDFSVKKHEKGYVENKYDIDESAVTAAPISKPSEDLE